ncbi:MAG TPA: hypothetical protein VJ867_16160 [Gemmatimonadaceae bacterium]|nr:hypothetical protein [Gemmatimonadaceae bacterium]
MAERQKYEKWLRDLEAKKASTPAHVYERVRGDYTARLDEVVGQLRQHTASMQEHARTLMTRLRELEAAEQDLKDEHSEQELRAQVGELTPGEWEAISRKAQRAIAKVQEDQESIADDLNKIRELLEGDSGEDDEDDDAEPPRRSTDFNELEFLKSVVGTSTPAASRTPPSAPSTRSSGEAARAQTPSGTRAVETTRRPTPAATPPVDQAKRPSVPVKAPEPPPAPAAAETSKVQITGDSPLTLRTSASTQVQKTLKCAECGTMNSPNEWYCEKCGAELANI